MSIHSPKVLVLYGGISDEREVSLRSGACVAEALREGGYDVDLFDYQGELPSALDADIVFPVLHGVGGEDGGVQAQLEARSIPFVGSGSVASALCFDKWAYKQLLDSNGITVPQGKLVSLDAYTASAMAGNPFVLKPYDGGSSIDTIIVRRPNELPIIDIGQAFERHDKLLMEELILGTEITVAVIGDTALPVIEIIPPEDGEFDYDNKYNGKTQEICPAESLTEAIQQAVQALASRIHTLCGCRDMSRTDMIVCADGRLVVLETNTIPGMTDQSLLPKAAAAAGYDFPTLVDRLVKASAAS